MPNPRVLLRFPQIASLAVLSALTLSAAPQLLLPTDPSAVIVIPNHVRISGKPVIVGSLPLGDNAPYLFVGRTARSGLTISLPEIHDLKAALLSPDGHWVAYTAREGVVIADLQGKVIGEEEDATICRWSPDGARLAMVLSGVSRSRDAGRGIAIYSLKHRSTEYLNRVAEDVAWGSKDTLFFSRADHVWAWDLETDDFSRTGHHGVLVSTDGLYSLDSPEGHWSRTRVMHDRTSADLSGPTFAALGRCTPEHFAQPFWVKGTDHLLCVSICGQWEQPAGSTQWACRTGVVNVLTSELIAAWPGMPVGTSADGKSVWITDGFEVSPQVLRSRRRAPSYGRTVGSHDPDEVHVVASGYSWSSRNPRKREHEERRDLTMKIGDLLPRRHSIEPHLTLLDILDARHAVFQLHSPGYKVFLPGEQPSSLAIFDVGTTPVVIVSDSVDGGYTLELSLNH